MKKRMAIVIIGLLILFGGIFGYGAVRTYMMKQYFAHFTPPPAVISSAKAEAVTWTPYISAIGDVEAVNGVNVTTEQPGMITHVYFASGQLVKKGDVILTIDDRTDVQDMKRYEALLAYNIITYKRNVALYAQDASAKDRLDEAKSQMNQTKASLARTKVIIDQKHVKAMFDGKIGIDVINTGQYLEPGDKIATLQALGLLYVRFYLPQQDLTKVHVGQTVEFTVDAFPGRTFTAKINAVNSAVNDNTRNIWVETIYHNKDNLVLPGMFTNCRVIMPQQENVVVVPQTSIAYSLYGNSIFVIHQKGKDKDGKPKLFVKRNFVTLGEQRDNKVIIKSGIKAGDDVVTSGQLKLQDGKQVKINNSVDIKQFNKNIINNPE